MNENKSCTVVEYYGNLLAGHYPWYPKFMPFPFKYGVMLVNDTRKTSSGPVVYMYEEIEEAEKAYKCACELAEFTQSQVCLYDLKTMEILRSE